MAKDTFETITKDGRLLYEYVRGSHLYGLNNEDSDVDTSGLFIAKKESLLDLGIGYQDQVSDDRNDTTWYEIGKFCNMLLKSNPTVLEALFVPESKIITPPSELVAPLFANRDQFITKECFKPFIAYAVEQIHKARGLNKKIVNPVTERLTPFDFAYTFYNQGSTKIKNWLNNRGLNKDFCGLVHIPNMHDTYGVYYDWGAHIHHYLIKYEDLEMAAFGANAFSLLFFGWFGYGQVDEDTKKFAKFIRQFYGINTKKQLKEWYDKNQEVIHYRGMCLENSTDMRGSSVSKGEKPLCWMVYNESGFKDHCKKYKEYKDWEKFRNPKRYESNLDKNYDSKNMMHCVRLMHMGQEIAEVRGINLERTWDKEYLMNIRSHKFEYDELMARVDADKVKLDEAIKNSTLRETIDVNAVNDMLIEIRKKLMGCFNKTGFFSHLPITYGDEIVMFVCADSYSRSCTRDNTPISVVGTGMTPIAPPFFGKYDDYGSIEHVVDDANHQLFTKIFGMTLEEFCDVMHDLGGVTIGDVKERLAELKNGEKDPNNYHHETIEDYEKLLALFEKVFGHEPVMHKYEENESSEEHRKFYINLHNYHVKKYNGTCFMLCMEHKSVYDKMVAVGREHYFDYWIGYKDEKKVTPEEAFDNTAESMRKLSEFSEKYIGNPFKFGLGTETIDFIDMLSSKLENHENSTEEQLEQLKNQSKLLDLLNFSRDIMKMHEHFGIKACMHDTVHSDKADFALYNNMRGDITTFKDIACNFVYFIESMRRTCTTFEPSPYHNQTVCYETVIPIFEEILATLKRKAKEYGEE